MTRWSRAVSATLCGGCAARLAEGDPILLRTLPNVKREFVRGVCCAGPAPPDLPAHVVRSSRTKKFTPLRASKPEWLPYREPVDREPGSEG